MSTLTQPTYGGGTITRRPALGGSVSAPCYTTIDSAFLVGELGDFIVTEASEKILVDETTSKTCEPFGATVAQRPSQGGSITTQKT